MFQSPVARQQLSVTVRHPHNSTYPLRRGTPRTIHYQAPVSPVDYETANSWVGFELGVAYRVNFSLRK